MTSHGRLCRATTALVACAALAGCGGSAPSSPSSTPLSTGVPTARDRMARTRPASVRAVETEPADPAHASTDGHAPGTDRVRDDDGDDDDDD